jgi:hypothetical protein
MPSNDRARKTERTGGEVMSVGSRRRTPKAGSLDRPGSVGARKQDWIASQLRRVYDEALQEEIPEDMLDLLRQLDDRKPEGEDDG